MQEETGAGRHTAIRGRPRWRTVVTVAVSGAVLLAAFALFQPGLFRLALLQPARDAVFFVREVQPFGDHAGIERHRPKPAQTMQLAAADSTAAHRVDIELDLWLPEGGPAPVALLLHGASPRGRRLGFNMLLAQRLEQAGWLVVTPDARGFGGSGMPDDPTDPQAWAVQDDVSRLVDFARQHPRGNGTVVAIGHSMGGGHLLQGALDQGLSHVALIGPTRDRAGESASLGQRIRFSSDRRIGRVLPLEVALASMRRHDVREVAASGRMAGTGAVLLMDGEREGEALMAVLREAAQAIGPHAVHRTVPDSHHYCGAYQLPWPMRTVYVRPEIFDRCVDVIVDFLSAGMRQPMADR